MAQQLKWFLQTGIIFQDAYSTNAVYTTTLGYDKYCQPYFQVIPTFQLDNTDIQNRRLEQSESEATCNTTWFVYRN